jgi:hypothetical protein
VLWESRRPAQRSDLYASAQNRPIQPKNREFCFESGNRILLQPRRVGSHHSNFIGLRRLEIDGVADA